MTYKGRASLEKHKLWTECETNEKSSQILKKLKSKKTVSVTEANTGKRETKVKHLTFPGWANTELRNLMGKY